MDKAIPYGMNSLPELEAPRYPVRLVASRTGLSPHVLRAWERRYGVVIPNRSEGGQRLYSDLDIERLRLLRRLTERGHAIGRIATLTLDALTRLDQETESAPEPARVPAASAEASMNPLTVEGFRGMVVAAVRAIRQFESAELQAILERAAITLGVPDFLDQVASPVLKYVGHGWAEGSVSIAQEHMATAVFRRVLGWLLGLYEVKGAAPRLVVATPPGETHEMGALMVAVSAAAMGWEVTYLGSDLPAADLLAAVSETEAQAVALSVVYVSDHAALEAALQVIRTGISRAVPLLLGGAAAPDIPLDSRTSQVTLIESLADLRTALQRLGTRAAQ